MELLNISDANGIRIIRIDNLKKKNAINKKTYVALAKILNEAGRDVKVKAVVLTGSGDFFSSGNDLTQNIEPPPEGQTLQTPLIEMTQAFIHFPKLLVAIVNGPAIGIAATIVAVCDIIYASEKAYFYTPFTRLGLCAEGCSSLTFPRILGTSKATEMLTLNHTMSADEAYKFGFVARVYKDEQEIWDIFKEIAQLPVGSIMANKRLMRRFTISELEQANKAEAAELGERMASEEAFEAMIRFQQSRKPKNKL